MKATFRFFFLFLVSVTLLAAGCSPATTPGENTNTDGGSTDGGSTDGNTVTKKSFLRVVHLSYDGPAVDVQLDGAKAIENLAYGKTSGFAEVDSGKRAVLVTPNGKTDELIKTDLELDADKSYTVFAVDEASKITAIVASSERKANDSKALVRFVHASPDAPAVDIKVGAGDGNAVFSNVAFKGIKDYIEVEPGDYKFVVTAAGKTDAVVSFEAIKLEAGKMYTVVAKGTLDANDSYDFAVRTFVDNDKGDASVDFKPIAQEDGIANLRVVHLSHDGPGVDVSVNGDKAIDNLEYGKSSGYKEVPAGKELALLVTPNGADTKLIEAKQTLAKDKSYSIFAVNAAANIEPVVAEDARAADPDKVKIRVLHGAFDAPAVDIKIGKPDGTALFENIAFKKMTDYKTVEPGVYVFVITAAGKTDAVVTFEQVEVKKGQVLTVVAHGTLDANDKFPFAVRVFVDNDKGDAFLDLKAAPAPGQKARVMVVHASPDAPAVDILVDDNKVKGDLKFGENTDYLSLDEKKYNVKVNVAGTSNTAFQADLDLKAGMNYTVLAVGTLKDKTLGPIVATDNLAKPAAGKAHIRFIHASPDAPAVDIAVKGGPVVFPNRKFKDISDFTPVDANTYTFEVRLAGTTTVALELKDIKLEEGKIYTVYAKGFATPNATPTLGAGIIVNNP